MNSNKPLTLGALLAFLPSAYTLLQGGDTAAPIRAVTDDSRLADATSLMIAIRGAQTDGHLYLSSAYARGCRVFLVERPPLPALPDDATVLCVADTKIAKAALAAAIHRHPANALTLCGITGTKGKTSVALLCYRLLCRLQHPVGYIGTEGAFYTAADAVEHRTPTRNTTPDATVLHALLADMRDAGVVTVLMEISSQSVLQHRIDGLRFAVGAFTNLSPDHISPTEHPDFEHYRACKQTFLRDFIPPEGTLVLNADDAHTPFMAQAAPAARLTFGIHSPADLRAEQLRCVFLDGQPATSFALNGQACTLALPGEYNVSNLLCAAAVLTALGHSLDAFLPTLLTLSVPGRLEPLPAPRGSAIFVDYAHNGVSLRSVLLGLRPYTRGRLLCLVGSVGGRTKLRRHDLGEAAALYADLTILTADNPDFEDPAAICREMAAPFRERGLESFVIYPDRADAIRRAISLLREGDVLLLAGKGCEDYQRICGEQQPFSERDIVTESVRELSLLS